MRKPRRGGNIQQNVRCWVPSVRGWVGALARGLPATLSRATAGGQLRAWLEAPPIALQCTPAEPCTHTFTKDPPPGARSRRGTREHGADVVTSGRRPGARSGSRTWEAEVSPAASREDRPGGGAWSSAEPRCSLPPGRDLLSIYWVLQRGRGDEPCRRRMLCQLPRSTDPPMAPQRAQTGHTTSPAGRRC